MPEDDEVEIDEEAAEEESGDVEDPEDDELI